MFVPKAVLRMPLLLYGGIALFDVGCPLKQVFRWRYRAGDEAWLAAARYVEAGRSFLRPSFTQHPVEGRRLNSISICANPWWSISSHQWSRGLHVTIRLSIDLQSIFARKLD
jgi:hypothetical protein